MKHRKRGMLVHLVPILLFYTGLFWCWRFLNKNKLTILMVHGVVDHNKAHQWRPLWSRIGVDHFEKVIALLAKYYHFVTLDDAVEMIQGRQKMIPYSMVVTFDDGYRNNLTCAYPILEKYNIPAIIYLATNYIGNNKPFWIDRLDYALQTADVNGKQFNIGGCNILFNSNNREEFKSSYKKIRKTAKAVKRADEEMVLELEDLSSQLEQASGKSLSGILAEDDWSGLLNWDEVVSSPDSLIYGAHTKDHVRLEFVEAGVASDQITGSKRAIEQATDKPCHHFCYPNGSYNQDIVQLVEACGFKSATTSDYGLNSIGDSVYKLKRMPFPIHDSPIWVLSEVTCLISVLSGVIRKIFGRK